MSIIWRVVVAVLAVVFAIALIPPVARIVGLPISGDLWLVLRLCIAAIAAFYIIAGFPWRRPPTA